MIDPLSGQDGTHALDGADALAPPPRRADDDRPGRDDPQVGGPPPVTLPALPVAANQAGAQRWMDADAAESRRATDPSPPRDDTAPARGAALVERPVRDAGPARLLPRAEPPPAPPAPRTPIAPGMGWSGPAADTTDDHGDPDDEPEWLRLRREEHEFARQFGEWRAGARPVGRRGGLSPVTLLILLALVVLIAVLAFG